MELWHAPSSCVLLLHENQPQKTEIQQLATISATSVINITGRPLIIEGGVWDSVMKGSCAPRQSSFWLSRGSSFQAQSGGAGISHSTKVPRLPWHRVSNTSFIFSRAKCSSRNVFKFCVKNSRSSDCIITLKSNGPVSDTALQRNSCAQSFEPLTDSPGDKALTDS